MCEQTATSALPASTTPALRNPLETAEFAISEESGLEILFSTFFLNFLTLNLILQERPPPPRHFERCSA
jgi:hypothetical protein